MSRNRLVGFMRVRFTAVSWIQEVTAKTYWKKTFSKLIFVGFATIISHFNV